MDTHRVSRQLSRLALRAGLGLGFREVVVQGAESLPAAGPLVVVGPTAILDVLLVRAVFPGVTSWVQLTGRLDRSPAEVDRHPDLQQVQRQLADGWRVVVLPRSEQPEAAEDARFLTAVVRAAKRACAAGNPTISVVGCSVTVAARRVGLPRLLVRFSRPVTLNASSPVDAAVLIDDEQRELRSAPTSWDGLIFQANLAALMDTPGLSERDRRILRGRFVSQYGRVALEPDVRLARDRFSRFRDRRLALGLSEDADADQVARAAVRNGALWLGVPLQFVGGGLLAPLRFGTAQALFGAHPRLWFVTGLVVSSAIAAGVALLTLRFPLVGALLVGGMAVAASGVVERRCVSLQRLLPHLRRILRPAREQQELFVERLAVGELTTAAVTQKRSADYGELFPVGSQDFEVRGSSILREGSDLVR